MHALSPSGESNFSLAPAASPPSLRRIILTGFMGAGKSTIGLLLAFQLGWRFVDVDSVMESAAETKIAQLFSQNGEPWFRQYEHQTIARLVSSSDPAVLALGGGAIEDQRTRTLLLTDTETRLIHLEASLQTILQRCHGTDSLRPILADRTNLEARYQQRLPLYRQSHFTIAVDSLPPESVVEAILATVSANRSA